MEKSTLLFKMEDVLEAWNLQQYVEIFQGKYSQVFWSLKVIRSKVY